VTGAAFILTAALLTDVGAGFSPPQSPPQSPAAEVISDVRVHGNHVTSDDEIVKIAGITIGAPLTSTTVADVTSRLKASKKFDDVSVLKRFASIEDPSKILLVLVVNEGPVRIEIPKDENAPITVVRRRGFKNLMYMPIFDAEDGYGVTAGVRLAYVGTAGKRSRFSFPLTFGGTKKAGAEFDRTFTRGPLTRIEVGSALQLQTNPAYQADDGRKKLWVKAERAMGPLRMNVNTGAQWVGFGGVDDSFRSVGGAVVFDTRLDPVLPRNAVFASASIDRLFFANGGPQLDRTRLDARGYLGLIRQTVFVVRVLRESADGIQPPYLRSILGGWSNLRGFKAGSFTGDTLVAGSAELRIPLNSPVSFARLGVSAFVDTGTVYERGQKLGDAPRYTGIGGAGWITAGPLRISLAVAHGRGASTRVNFGGGLSF
jgi:outer membrane protein assembly factor BamA